MDQLFTTHDAAKILQVHPYTVAKWMDRGLLKAWKTAGGHRRVQAADLRRYLLDHQMPIPPELDDGNPHLRLLVVDDEPLALRAIQRAFKPFEDEVQLTTTSSGVDALLLLMDLKPDAMLIDVNMPDLDGFEVCRRVRGYQALSSVTLVAITALHRPDIVEAALKAGAAACLAKPFAVEQVLGLVRAGRAPPGRGRRGLRKPQEAR